MTTCQAGRYYIPMNHTTYTASAEFITRELHSMVYEAAWKTS